MVMSQLLFAKDNDVKGWKTEKTQIIVLFFSAQKTEEKFASCVYFVYCFAVLVVKLGEII